jgi:CheY-like chemotaxis protein
MTRLSPLILVAIENAAVRLPVQSALERAGFRVSATTTGKEVITRLRRAAFQLTLLGLSFPDGDGFELIDRVRALPSGPGLSVIAIAECDCPACRRLLTIKDFTDYLFWPVDPDRLLATVHAYLPLRYDPGSPD